MAHADPLDDALADLRVSGCVLLHEAYRPAWAVAVPAEADLRALLKVGPDSRVIPFHVARRGGFTLRFGDRAETLAAGEVSLVAGGSPHGLGVGRAAPVPLASILAGGAGLAPLPHDDPSPDATELVCGAFTLRAAPLNPLLSALPPVLKVPAAGALASIADLLAAELARGAGGGFSARRLLELLCGEVLRAWTLAAAAGDATAGWRRGLADPKVAAALGAIHAAPAESWSVERLAMLVALSPSRFAARFRDAMGDSVMAYVAAWRVNLASRLLDDTDQPLKTIAAACGFEDGATFSRAFKARLGVAPSAWRARAAT